MALENLGIKRSNVTNYVFRLLARSRVTIEQYTGAAFMQMAPTLRSVAFSGLIHVEMPGGVIGRLLYQNGNVVFAGQGDLEPRDALWVIQRTAGDSVFSRFPLANEQMFLGLAAVDGAASVVGMSVPTDGATLFAEQQRREFSGVLALESGSSLLIWQFVKGRTTPGGPEIPADIERYRLIQIAWAERQLPEMSLAFTGLPASGQGGAGFPAPSPARPRRPPRPPAPRPRRPGRSSPT